MKIDREKMRLIGEAVTKREELRQVIRSTYSNESLAARFAVNVRTIEKLAALHRPAHEGAK